MTYVQIASNAIHAKLVTTDKTVKAAVSDILSYQVESAEFMGAGRWDGRSSFFSARTASFPAGFVHLVHAELTRTGHKVQLARKPLPAPLGPDNPIVDEFGNEDPRYDYQMKALRAVERHGRGILQVATGGGKCLGRDTPILMFDGTIKPVQDVVVGDLLMGPDSTPRRVLSTCAGRDPLYRVTPTKGDSYVVNNAHILSLKKTSRGYRGRKRDGEKYPKGEVVNINVETYLAETKTFRHIHKGWRTGVDFAPGTSLPVDPYFLGALLGDGGINGTVQMTTADPEIVAEVERQAELWGIKANPYPKEGNRATTYHMTVSGTGGRVNPLMKAMRDLGLSHGDKHIPHSYKTASRPDRLALLAGLIDTDGYYDGKCVYVTLKNERLLDDLIFVARSLGFAAYKKAVTKRCYNNGVDSDCFATVISGHLDQIPVRLERRRSTSRAQKKDHLVHGLTVEPIGEGEYFGFEIDGDSLFLLGDFTVTHNTKIAKLIVARYNRMTLFLTTRGVLMHQMADAMTASGRKTGYIGDGLFQPVRGFNVGMVQTFVAKLKEPDLNAEYRELVRQNINKDLGRAIDEMKAEAKANFEAKVKERNRYIKLLEMFEVVIGEEAHEAGGNSYYEILRHCKNADIRVALTATPFMRDAAEDNMRLMAAFGPVLIQVTEKTLIDRGILAKPYFKFERYTAHPKLRKTSPWQRARQLGIVECEGRNAKIVGYVKRAAAAGMPSLVLVTMKAHGELLKKLIAAAGVTVEYLKGENNQAERKKALAKLASGKVQCLIGTTIVDVGVDVPALGMVILAGGGKAEVALRQRIGRGLRAKKAPLPNIAFIVDFADDEVNSHLKDHYRQRRAIVEATPGFAEGILAPNEDFPWSEFEAVKSAA